MIGKINTGGLNIHGLIEEYKVASGGKVSAGDFVKFISNFENPIQLTSLNTTVNKCIPIVMNQDTVFIVFSYTDSDYVAGVVCKFNDNNEITVGTITNLSSTTNMTFGGVVATKLNSETVMVACSWGSGRYYLYGFVCKIEGMNITMSSFNYLSTSRVDNEARNLELITLEENKVLLTYYYANYATYGMICETDGSLNVITRGTPVMLTSRAATRTLNFNSAKFFYVAMENNALHVGLGSIDGDEITIRVHDIDFDFEISSIVDRVVLNEHTALLFLRSTTNLRIFFVD